MKLSQTRVVARVDKGVQRCSVAGPNPSYHAGFTRFRSLGKIGKIRKHVLFSKTHRRARQEGALKARKRRYVSTSEKWKIPISPKIPKLDKHVCFTLSVGLSILGAPASPGNPRKVCKKSKNVVFWNDPTKTQSPFFVRVKNIVFSSFPEHFYTTRHPCFHMCFLLFAYRPLRVNVLDFQGLHTYVWQTWRRRKSVFHHILSFECIFHCWG